MTHPGWYGAFMVGLSIIAVVIFVVAEARDDQTDKLWGQLLGAFSLLMACYCAYLLFETLVVQVRP